MPDIAVRCQHLYKSFDETPVIQDVSFQLAAGQILALLGPSGCGKTTTLRLIAGFEALDAGIIEIAGIPVANQQRHLPPEKRRVGMVFQDYAIFPHLNVAQNVGFGLKRGSDAAQRVAEMLRFVGLDRLGDRMPHQLSGGQQQRVALARALAPEPAILLFDEPFSNLDAALRVEVREEVRMLLGQRAVTAIFVTHDQEEALFMGDQVAVMNAGMLEQLGTPEAVFHEPRTHFVAEFVGQTDFIAGIVRPNGVDTVLGLLPQLLPLPLGTDVDVAVRPDDVFLEADVAGNGWVMARHFAGINYIYRLTFEDGSILHSWQPHTVKINPQDKVRAKFRSGHSLACFYQGRAVD